MTYDKRYQRNLMLWGKDVHSKLSDSHVVVLGLGGVGGGVVESLTRSGVGKLTIVDNDTVDISNFNRQLIATTSTIDLPKTDAMEQRIHLINPYAEVVKHQAFYTKDFNDQLFQEPVHYVIDAIDSVVSKVDLAEYCIRNKVKLVASMGTGNRLNPLALTIKDIKRTEGLSCALTRKYRRLLSARLNPRGIKVLVSTEMPNKPNYDYFDMDEQNPKRPPASSPFVPPVAGIILANFVVRKLTGV